MLGERPLENPAWGKIINKKHFDRLSGLIDPAKVVWGGGSDAQTLQIEPTVMDGVTAEDAVMGEEIFGPIMPLITYKTIEEAEAFIKARPKPLALYLFTQSKALEDRFLRHVPFGGAASTTRCSTSPRGAMGFGGVGASGMGSYHGIYSFRTFSHEKSGPEEVQLDRHAAFATSPTRRGRTRSSGFSCGSPKPAQQHTLPSTSLVMPPAAEQIIETLQMPLRARRHVTKPCPQGLRVIRTGQRDGYLRFRNHIEERHIEIQRHIGLGMSKPSSIRLMMTKYSVAWPLKVVGPE